MVPVVREIVSSAMMWRSLMARQGGSRGGGGFCSAAPRRDHRIEFIGGLGRLGFFAGLCNFAPVCCCCVIDGHSYVSTDAGVPVLVGYSREVRQTCKPIV